MQPKESVIDSHIYRNDLTPRAVWGLGLFLLAAFVFCYASVFMTLAGQWWSNNIYSYGFLIPLISGYLLWVRREEIFRLAAAPDYLAGSIVLLLGLSMLLIGKTGGVVSVQEVSIIVTFSGGVLLLLGRRIFRAMWPAIAYLIFMIPSWEMITNRLHFPFQSLSAILGVTLLQFFGIPVYQEGIYLQMPNITLEVANVCSGVNYLIAVVAIGIPMGILFLDNWKKRVFLVLFAVAIAALSNGLRVALIAGLSYSGFNGALHGPFHLLQGIFVSMIGYGALFAGLMVLSGGSVAFPSPPKSDRIHWPFRSIIERKEGKVIILSLSILLLGAGVYVHFRRPTPVLLKENLAGFPSHIGEWMGADAIPLHRTPGADQELSRVYRSASGETIYLYVGHYSVQRPGGGLINEKTQELEGTSVPVPIEISGNKTVAVNRVVQPEGERKRVSLYWYHLDGRALASRYRAKALTLWNALVSNRTDGAVVIVTSDRSSLPTQEIVDRSAAFLRELFPLLDEALSPGPVDSLQKEEG